MAEDHFGDEVAERYDAAISDMFAPAVIDAVVDRLAELAGSGGALELGIGTGRVALPLQQRGVTVQGIDLSEAMVRKLREKAHGTTIPVTIGDFGTVNVGAKFALVYLVFNTIMNLTTQDAQVACFRNAADQLETGGYFVVEVMTPDLKRLPAGEVFRPQNVSPTQLSFDEYDVVTQGLVSHHYRIEDAQATVQSIPFRYVWPSELDLMARLAGMELHARWGDWTREPFTALSAKHVSVWVKAATTGLLDDRG